MLKFLQKRKQRKQVENSFRGLLTCSPSVRSQSGQDLFALFASDFKEGGYFVEFGATDGVALSNTWLLEKKFKWNGILAEPAMIWHADLLKNRSCHIEFDCVWSVSGKKLDFLETSEATLSTVENFHSHDGRRRLERGNNSLYSVNTISLLDLLKKYEAPKFIDFLSIDTEGSELAILEVFDWSEFEFGAICIEHNYTKQRNDLHRLLTGHGYFRVLEGISGADDWYLGVRFAPLTSIGGI